MKMLAGVGIAAMPVRFISSVTGMKLTWPCVTPRSASIVSGPTPHR
jgi:hypothetical protein